MSTYRPQYAYPPPPPGWEDEEFVYYFDSSNTPALANVPFNQIPLTLEPDAEFYLRGIEVSGNVGNLVARFWKGNTQISQTLVEVDRAYGSSVQGVPPVGKLPVPIEPEILCEPGSQILVDLALM